MAVWLPAVSVTIWTITGWLDMSISDRLARLSFSKRIDSRNCKFKPTPNSAEPSATIVFTLLQAFFPPMASKWRLSTSSTVKSAGASSRGT